MFPIKTYTFRKKDSYEKWINFQKDVVYFAPNFIKEGVKFIDKNGYVNVTFGHSDEKGSKSLKSPEPNSISVDN